MAFFFPPMKRCCDLVSRNLFVPLPRTNFLKKKVALAIAVQLSRTAYPVILGKLNHIINLINYLISILHKLETRHSWKAGQVFFRIQNRCSGMIGLGFFIYLYILILIVCLVRLFSLTL